MASNQISGLLQGLTPLDELGTARDNFAQVIKQMKNTRKERVLIKNDCTLLENRIKILKLEEQRAWARIQKSRARAKKILLIRQQQAYEGDVRAAELDLEKRAKRANKMTLQKHREVLKAQIAANREKAKLAKRLHVQNLKNEKAKLQREIELEKQEALKHAKGNNARIRDEERTRREKLASRKAEKIRTVQEQYEDRLRQEEAQRRGEELSLQKLEEEELELIQRLQSTQQFATSQSKIFDVTSAPGSVAR